MLYLSSFTFPGGDAEWDYRLHIKRKCYTTIYPFYVLPQTGLDHISFAPVTILYGGNGSGKSTALNVIAEKLSLRREAPYNRSDFFEDFVSMCKYTQEEPIPAESSIITSDDVFDFMLSVRSYNEGIDRKRAEMFDEYFYLRDGKNSVKVRSLEDYDALRRQNEARRKTQSRFVRDNLRENIREHSNGESSDIYFKDHIREDVLCLLDEPENSLSPENQKKLADFLFESVRYCGCQLVLATHSPFLLAIPGARIYDLDHGARVAENWAELDNVRVYYDFFRENDRRFRKD